MHWLKIAWIKYFNVLTSANSSVNYMKQINVVMN